MSVIGATTIGKYAGNHAAAGDELVRWIRTAKHARWCDLNDVRQHFPDADQYKSLLIFNIRHNHYRLIVKVDYRAGLLLIKEFLPHKDYARGDWKKWAR